MITSLLCFAAGAYVLDVLVRPAEAAAVARQRAHLRNKPLLNIGAGTPQSSMRSGLFGPTLWGDANLDLAAPELAPGPDWVSFGDAHALPFPDKYFGAVIASHVLEHVDHPHAVLAELHRVADEVYVITPPWWTPHAWLHPGHQWLRRPDGHFVPLWRRET